MFLPVLLLVWLIDKVQASGLGCHVNMACLSILLYADDILLVSPSVSSLQCILRICEAELDWFAMNADTKR